MNDIDYYPEEYLSRLAHEGVNGLWLTITFREICDTSIRKAVPEAVRRDLVRQGFEHIYSNLDDSAEVEKNRKKRNRRRLNSPA